MTPAELSINTIRFLSIDAVQKANSGHPGTPMALAPAAHVLWRHLLCHNPSNPKWTNRDRFVLSCGHASMLLYSVLFLSGYGLTLDDLKEFRQMGSLTPGHPEHGHTLGVETTTGPLGQGLGNAVGMAMAERFLAQYFNRKNYSIVDHYTYAFCSDGDLMEGVGQEAASIAGHLGLGKLIVLWDNNNITIEGSTDLSFKEDVGKRFEAYGWKVIKVHNGEDTAALTEAFKAAKVDEGRPVLIDCKTQIGFPAPNKKGTAKAHGEPLGASEVQATRDVLDWKWNEFEVPPSVLEDWRLVKTNGQEKETKWNALWEKYRVEFPELAEEFERSETGKLHWPEDHVLQLFAPTESIATREASGRILNLIAESNFNFLGGSADLAPSNNSSIKKGSDFTSEAPGRNIHWGVREHGMGACLNGMALHGSLRVFGATFLQFADYMRPSIRLAALMKLPLTYIFTHDSIGLGEDGPTHQPIEHLMSLRIIPHMRVFRPADAFETIEAWKAALGHHKGPTALVLTRQKVPNLTQGKAVGLSKGAYVLQESSETPKLILIASGSELSIAIEASQMLEKQKISCRVVSIPSLELFMEQSENYRNTILPPAMKKRIVIEAGVAFGWEGIAGSEGKILGINQFGLSAPASDIYKTFKLTASDVVSTAENIIS